MDLVIKGGTVVTAEGQFVADVGVEGGQIVALGKSISSQGKTIDATGKYVLPGVIDVHTHVALGDEKTADKFYDDTVAAAHGGTTTILNFLRAPGSLVEMVRTWKGSTSRNAAIDYGFHIVTTPANTKLLDEMPTMMEEGCPTFKVFMVYEPDRRMNDYELFQVMMKARELGGMVMVHCENAGAIDYLVAQYVKEGKTAPKYHAPTRPPETEGEAVGRAIALARIAGTPLYVVHISCREALRRLKDGKEEGGVLVYGETCTQYLTLSEECYEAPGFEAARYVLTPPLRHPSHQEALWKALANGLLDVVSTDHVPYSMAVDKIKGKSFDQIPNGAPGLETLLTLVYSAGVRGGHISLSRMVEVLSTNPARIFGLANKGSIAIGKDADLVIFDPDQKWTIGTRTLHLSMDYTPYEGLEVTGKVRDTILRGQIIVQNGKYVGNRDDGQFVHRNLTLSEREKVAGVIPAS